MTTPEGHVKAKLRKLLDEYPNIYTYWPVPSGFGRTTLDVLGCYRGRFFTVETKAEGKQPTARQTKELNGIEKSMGKSFVISGTLSPVFDDLRCWLDDITSTVPYAPVITPDPVNRRRI